MPRVTAGRRYPHATTEAREHDHTWCAIVGAIADHVTAGDEPWGTPHPLSLPSRREAERVRAGIYRARYCRELTARYGEPLSVQAIQEQGAGGWTVTLRVWTRTAATRWVAAGRDGQGLAYNVLRGK